MRLHGDKKEKKEKDEFLEDAAKALVLFTSMAVCRNARALNYAKKKVQEDPETYQFDLKTCLKDPFIKCEDYKTIISMVSAVAFVNNSKPKDIGDFFLKFFPEAKKVKLGQSFHDFCMENSFSPRGTFDFLNNASIYLSQVLQHKNNNFPALIKDDFVMTALTHMIKLVESPAYNQTTVPPNVKKLAKAISARPFLDAVAENDFDDTVNYIYNVMKLYDVSPSLLENAKISGRKWEQLIALLKESDLIKEDEMDSVKDYLFIARIVASLSDAFAKERGHAIDLHMENEELRKKLTQPADAAAVPDKLEQERSHLLDQIRELQTNNDKLQIKLSDVQSELQSANEYIAQIEAADEQEEQESADENKREVAESYPDGTILIGGHGRWQKFFHQKYPNVRIIDGNDRNFNKGMFSAQTPLVLVNTTHLSHACFGRLSPIVKQLNLDVKYIYGLSERE